MRRYVAPPVLIRGRHITEIRATPKPNITPTYLQNIRPFKIADTVNVYIRDRLRRT